MKKPDQRGRETISILAHDHTFVNAIEKADHILRPALVESRKFSAQKQSDLSDANDLIAAIRGLAAIQTLFCLLLFVVFIFAYCLSSLARRLSLLQYLYDEKICNPFVRPIQTISLRLDATFRC